MNPSTNCIVMMVFLILIYSSFYSSETSKGFYSLKQRLGQLLSVCLLLSGFIGSYGKTPGIEPCAFQPVHSGDEHMSGSGDRDLERNADSE